MGTVGYIKWPNGEYAITDEDLLWAGRAAARETNNSVQGRAAVLWSWAQRLVWYKGLGRTVTPCREQPNRPLTLTWVIRCHSQPVNAYWRDRGDAGQIRARQYLQSDRATWESLERGEVLQAKPNLKRDVYAWARGELPNPVPNLADFSAPGQPDVPAGSPTVGGNAFFAEPGAAPRGTASWPPGYVRIEPARGLQRLFDPRLALGLGLATAALGLVLLLVHASKAKAQAQAPQTMNRRRSQRYVRLAA